ncbi:hypothetical protein L6452_43156 [Arctium lappa]|uniref:Uncharacterized protein n=1 Tax=Arctium lappa TaxID=4217 RepID=A0ACB8XK67_ARCLA|nr:hypothetical protein L6452_43156 [Arctium lappa]
MRCKTCTFEAQIARRPPPHYKKEQDAQKNKPKKLFGPCYFSILRTLSPYCLFLSLHPLSKNSRFRFADRLIYRNHLLFKFIINSRCFFTNYPYTSLQSHNLILSSPQIEGYYVMFRVWFMKMHTRCLMLNW